MLNIKAVEQYYNAVRYNESLSPEGLQKWGKPENKLEALSFKTREEYLQWVKEWKAEYKKVSIDSRLMKKARKQGPGHNPAARELVWEFRHYAGALLFARKEGKAYSWQLKMEKLKQAS